MPTMDFSRFHPLDHLPGPACRGLPGGFWLHLRYGWIFLWAPAIRVAARHVLGLHSWVAMARRTGTVADSMELMTPPGPNSPDVWTYRVVCEGRNCRVTPDPATARRVIAEQWKVET